MNDSAYRRRSSVFLALAMLIGWTIASLVHPVIGAEQEATAASSDFPAELTSFTPYANNPVFLAAGPGHWDVRIRERGWILRERKAWHLWYTGYDGSRDGLKMLGHATSPDGLHWTRDAANPLDREQWIEDMMVVRHDGIFYMFAEERDQAQWLTSTDGFRWKRQGALDVRTMDGKPLAPGPLGTLTVWREAKTWYLMYERGDRAVWLAATKDLRAWTNVQDEPVLRPGSGDYDQVQIAVDQVIKYRCRYYAYYHGSGTSAPPRPWTTNVAVSTDRVHWKKYPGKPIVPGDRSSGIVVPEGSSESGNEDAPTPPSRSNSIDRRAFDSIRCTTRWRRSCRPPHREISPSKQSCGLITKAR